MTFRSGRLFEGSEKMVGVSSTGGFLLGAITSESGCWGRGGSRVGELDRGRVAVGVSVESPGAAVLSSGTGVGAAGVGFWLGGGSGKSHGRGTRAAGIILESTWNEYTFMKGRGQLNIPGRCAYNPFPIVLGFDHSPFRVDVL